MLLFLFMITFGFFFANEIRYKNLFDLTDKYVESLYTKYESYGFAGNAELTKNGKYQVMPIGRLINVKIMDSVADSKYENLRKILETHYRNDDRVKDVYRAQVGTLMIDCRN